MEALSSPEGASIKQNQFDFLRVPGFYPALLIIYSVHVVHLLLRNLVLIALAYILIPFRIQDDIRTTKGETAAQAAHECENGIQIGFICMNEQADADGHHPKRGGRRRSGLQVQFQIALGTIFLLFCGLTAWLIYAHEKNHIEQEALNKSRIVLAAVESTQAYVQGILRPKMYEVVGRDAFIMEAMSTSFVSRAVMDKFHESMPMYRYRRVALKARNPVSAPTPVEREMIEYFQKHPLEKHWQGIREIGGTSGFLDAQPVFMTASCLNCHGRPEDAPPSLIRMYGDKRGFGYRENQLAGITVVSIPVQDALAKIRGKAFSVFCATLVMLIFMYVLISFLFNRMVVHSLRDLLGIFRRGLMDDREIALLTEASSKNEIHELSEAARELTAHLQKARRDLVRYAEDLEVRVNNRTRDLESSRARLKEKVAARDLELLTLNRIAELTTRSFRLTDIFPGVLEQTLSLIPARGAAIYLFSGDKNNPALAMEYQRNADKLSPTIKAGDRPASGQVPSTLKESIWTAAHGEMSHFACMQNQTCLNVPLVCRERVLGVMTFVGIDLKDRSSEMQSLLMSIGQQIGITIDSLNNFAALLQSKELLQSVFDGIPDMMVLLSPDLDIRMANRAYLKRHSITLEEALNQKCRPLENGCEWPLAGRQLSQAMSTHQPAKEEITTASGEIFMVYYYPILDEADKIWGILRYARDITLEKQVENRIQQTEKMAALGQLAAGVAHEINNPMGIILCYTDLLKRQIKGDEQAVQDIEIVEKQAGNCRRIVSDLLNFSRRRKTRSQPANINTALSEVIEMLRHQFQKSGTEIETELDQNLPVLSMDVDKMKQVFLNLLMNANQAIVEPPGQVRVCTRFDKNRSVIEIAIRDNGSGIAPEIIGKIFDPFFSTKQTGEGTGLGLSVSYGIIKDHGGELTVETEIGEYTEFNIQLPARRQENGIG